MKRKILLILNMAIIGFSTAACSDDETNYITPEKKYPLTAFAVAINNVSANTTSYYHGKIDQTTHRVEIGTIEDANTITGVLYANERWSHHLTGPGNICTQLEKRTDSDRHHRRQSNNDLYYRTDQV